MYAYAENTLSDGNYETIFTRVNVSSNEHTDYSFINTNRSVQSFICHEGVVYMHLTAIHNILADLHAVLLIFNDKSPDPFGFNHK